MKYKSISSYNSSVELRKQTSKVTPTPASKRFQNAENNQNDSESPPTHPSHHEFDQTAKCKIEEQPTKQQCPGCNGCSIF